MGSERRIKYLNYYEAQTCGSERSNRPTSCLSLVKIPFGANAFEISDIKDAETEAALAMQKV